MGRHDGESLQRLITAKCVKGAFAGTAGTGPALKDSAKCLVLICGDAQGGTELDGRSGIRTRASRSLRHRQS